MRTEELVKVDYINIRRETERLIIRTMRESDFSIVHRELHSQGKPQSKYDDEEIELAERLSAELHTANIKRAKKAAEEDRSYLFRAFRMADDAYIGGIIVKTIQRKNFQWAEIGYWLLNQHWGNRYGSEMLKAVINIAFTELSFHRLEAHINLDNFASQKTAEQAGMEFECIRKGFILESGIWTDNMVYVINRN